MEHELNNRLNELEKKYKRLKTMTFSCIVIASVAFIGFGFSKINRFDVIRTKGIIIEDEKGRDRILIGAPIPYSKDRVRTDSIKVKQHWAPSFGKESKNYMKYYKDYNHATDGIVIMNAEGFDRILVGDKLADPNTGKKMFESAGITWNDTKGWELGGAGVNTSADGMSRAVIGLDDPKSTNEAVHLVALEDGTKALIIGNENGRLIIGMSNTDSSLLQNKGAFTGVKYFDREGQQVWEQQMNLSK